MNRRWILMIMICLAVLSAVRVIKKETPAKARLVKVERRDVHQVVPLTGKLIFADAGYIYAESSGNVKRVCVEAGQRVGEGQLLLCLGSERLDEELSIMYANGSAGMMKQLNEVNDQEPAARGVIRSRKTCTIRQVMAEEGMYIYPGIPLFRCSSNQQKIICRATVSDIDKIQQGMWAWISFEGERIGFAVVQQIGERYADAVSEGEETTIILTPEQYIDLPEGTEIDTDIFLAGSDDALSLPLEAITQRDTVWWVHEGKCIEIPAKIVLCDELYAWVELPEGLVAAVGEFTEGYMIAGCAE